MSVRESSGGCGAGTKNESGPRRRLAGPARRMDGEQQTTYVENLYNSLRFSGVGTEARSPTH